MHAFVYSSHYTGTSIIELQTKLSKMYVFELVTLKLGGIIFIQILFIIHNVYKNYEAQAIVIIRGMSNSVNVISFSGHIANLGQT